MYHRPELTAPQAHPKAAVRSASMTRPNPWHLGIALFGLSMLAFYLITWTQGSPQEIKVTDFGESYAAASLIRDGHSNALYAPSTSGGSTTEAIAARAWAPPLTAAMVIPLTSVDVVTAYRAACLTELFLLAAAALVAITSTPGLGAQRWDLKTSVTVFAVGGTATLIMLLLGQWDGIIAFGLAMAYRSWRRSQNTAAGLWLGFCFGLTKPQLTLGLIAFMLGRRDWKALSGFSVSAIVQIAATMWITSPGTIPAFLSNAIHFGGTDPGSAVSFAGLMASWIGAPIPTALTTLVLSIFALVLAYICGSKNRSGASLEISLAAAMLLSILLSIHSGRYDMAILIPLFIWLAAGIPLPWLVVFGVVIDVLVMIDDPASPYAPPRHILPAVVFAAALLLTNLLRRTAKPQNFGATTPPRA